MYTQEQRRAHVRGLQQDLRVVQAALGEPLPKVSGVYDDATEHAVECNTALSLLKCLTTAKDRCKSSLDSLLYLLVEKCVSLSND